MVLKSMPGMKKMSKSVHIMSNIKVFPMQDGHAAGQLSGSINMTNNINLHVTHMNKKKDCPPPPSPHPPKKKPQQKNPNRIDPTPTLDHKDYTSASWNLTG